VGAAAACVRECSVEWLFTAIVIAVVQRERQAQSAPASLRRLTCSLSFSIYFFLFLSSTNSFLISYYWSSILKKSQTLFLKTFSIVHFFLERGWRWCNEIIHLQLNWKLTREKPKSRFFVCFCCLCNVKYFGLCKKKKTIIIIIFIIIIVIIATSSLCQQQPTWWAAMDQTQWKLMIDRMVIGHRNDLTDLIFLSLSRGLFLFFLFFFYLSWKNWKSPLVCEKSTKLVDW
jgi:hypothetical protein